MAILCNHIMINALSCFCTKQVALFPGYHCVRGTGCASYLIVMCFGCVSMSQPLHVYADRWINLVKWPVGLASVVALWPAVQTLGDVLGYYRRHYDDALALILGVAVFFVPRFFQKRGPAQSFWGTFEHEMTHILFALLTLHPVKAVHASDGDGGVMQHTGMGNWLIAVGPYFFPTFPLLVSLLALALPSSLKLVGVGGCGFALAWHISASLAETHSGQSDLRRVGLPFAFMFLPGASVLCIGFVLAVVFCGSYAPIWFWAKLSGHLVQILS